MKMNELEVVLRTGFKTFFETELDTLACTSFAGGGRERISSPSLPNFFGGLITYLEHSYSSLSIME